MSRKSWKKPNRDWGKRIPENSITFRKACDKSRLAPWKIGKLIEAGVVFPYRNGNETYLSMAIVGDLQRLYGLLESGLLETEL